MCHFSSDCSGCCLKCQDKCNSEQVCMQGQPGQFERLQSWHNLIKSNNYFKHLEKYIYQNGQ